MTEKIVRISDLANVLHGFRILLIQQIADLSNILARIADFASNLGGSADLYTPIHPPPPPPIKENPAQPFGLPDWPNDCIYPQTTSQGRLYKKVY